MKNAGDKHPPGSGAAFPFNFEQQSQAVNLDGTPRIGQTSKVMAAYPGMDLFCWLAAKFTAGLIHRDSMGCSDAIEDGFWMAEKFLADLKARQEEWKASS